MPKKLMRIEKHIEDTYKAKGYTKTRAERIGFATISKKYGWRKGKD